MWSPWKGSQRREGVECPQRVGPGYGNGLLKGTVGRRKLAGDKDGEWPGNGSKGRQRAVGAVRRLDVAETKLAFVGSLLCVGPGD